MNESLFPTQSGIFELLKDTEERPIEPLDSGFIESVRQIKANVFLLAGNVLGTATGYVKIGLENLESQDESSQKATIDMLTSAHRSLERLDESVVRRPQLLLDMIDPSRYRMAQTNFDTIRDELLREVLPLDEQKTQYEIICPETTQSFLADSSKIGLATAELIKNGCEAVKKKKGEGKVWVVFSIDEHSKEAVISVADSGVGMIPELCDNLCTHNMVDKEEFPTYVFLQNGGWGLPITKTIVERHKGRLSVKTKEGIGSIFTLRLPLYTQQKMVLQ